MLSEQSAPVDIQLTQNSRESLAEVEAALEHLGFVGGNLTAAGRAYEEVQLIDTPIDPTPVVSIAGLIEDKSHITRSFRR